MRLSRAVLVFIRLCTRLGDHLPSSTHLSPHSDDDDGGDDDENDDYGDDDDNDHFTANYPADA